MIEVARRQAKVKESDGNPENLSKFEAAQARLKELKSNMTKLGKEAVATMSAVEAQQQRLTLQRLIAMVMLVLLFYFPFKKKKKKIVCFYKIPDRVLEVELMCVVLN